MNGYIYRFDNDDLINYKDEYACKFEHKSKNKSTVLATKNIHIKPDENTIFGIRSRENLYDIILEDISKGMDCTTLIKENLEEYYSILSDSNKEHFVIWDSSRKLQQFHLTKYHNHFTFVNDLKTICENKIYTIDSWTNLRHFIFLAGNDKNILVIDLKKKQISHTLKTEISIFWSLEICFITNAKIFLVEIGSNKSNLNKKLDILDVTKLFHSLKKNSEKTNHFLISPINKWIKNKKIEKLNEKKKNITEPKLKKSYEKLVKDHENISKFLENEKNKLENLEIKLSRKTKLITKKNKKIKILNDNNNLLKNQLRILEEKSKHNPFSDIDIHCPISLGKPFFLLYLLEIIKNLFGLKCGHVFEKHLIEQSLEKNPTCPICRSVTAKNDIYPVILLKKILAKIKNKYNLK